MSKITLNTVGSLLDATTAATTINGNFTTIQTAFDNTLSRDGISPSQMLNSLDMNSNQIVNLPNPATVTSPLRLQDLNTFVGGGTITNIPSGGTTGQVLRKNSNTNYDIGFSNSVTSVGLSLPADFTVTNSPVTTTGTLTGAWATTPTGTGAMVRATSPTLITPSLGTASANSINKVALTQPATGSTLTIADGKTAVFNNSLTINGSDGTTQTFPNTNGTVCIVAAAQTLTNKIYNGTSLAVTGAITSSGAGIGYATGAGGAVTQLTSRTTGVTLNTLSGAITLFSQVNTAVSGATAQTFTVTNSTVAATDTIIVNQKSGTDKYLTFITNVAAGSFQITNYTTGGTTNEAPVFNFNVIKGVIS